MAMCKVGLVLHHSRQYTHDMHAACMCSEGMWACALKACGHVHEYSLEFGRIAFQRKVVTNQ